MTFRKPRTRSRVTPNGRVPVLLGYFEFLDPNTKTWKRDTTRPKWEYVSATNWDSWEITGDESHGAPPYTIGGPFRKVSCRKGSLNGGPCGGGTFYSRDGKLRYIGGFSPDVSGFMEPPGWTGPPAPSEATFSSMLPSMSSPVTKAWNGAKPKIQQVGLANALFEVGEIPSMLGTTARGFHEAWQLAGGNRRSWSMAPSTVADNFLNQQFGWVPFLSDVRGAINTYQNSTNIIARITRNNGQSIRRKVTVENVVSDIKIFEGGAFHTPYGFPDEMYARLGWPGTGEIRRKTTRSVVGSGRFRYYIPHFDAGNPNYHSSINNARRNMDIYGLRINPSNVYQAIPFSWAADWVSNVGDYVHRLSDQLSDNLAAEYFYVTLREKVEHVYVSTYPLNSGTITVQSSHIVETKQRVEGASPFGVSLSWANLSPRQWAIAGALGLTSGRR